MKIITCSDFLNEAEAPNTGTAPATPGTETTAPAPQIDKNAYTQAKSKVDALCRNTTLNDEDLQAEFDKAVADMDAKDSITYYFGTKKLERRKTALETEAQQIAKQLGDRQRELVQMEKNIQA